VRQFKEKGEGNLSQNKREKRAPVYTRGKSAHHIDSNRRRRTKLSSKEEELACLQGGERRGWFGEKYRFWGQKKEGVRGAEKSERNCTREEKVGPERKRKGRDFVVFQGRKVNGSFERKEKKRGGGSEGNRYGTGKGLTKRNGESVEKEKRPVGCCSA